MVQLLKLGGSVLTHKDSDTPALRQGALDRLAAEIAAVDDEIVIVHGAGSFGHPVAEAHDLVAGVSNDEDAAAMAQVHADVRRLNLAVLDALREAGRAPISLPPFGQLGANDGRPGSWNLVPVHRSLELGLTPVTFGDVVIDTTRGATIVSGDQLMAELSRFLQPKRATFAIDEDGVYDGQPGDGQPLGETTLEALRAAVETEETKGSDVTGGMAGKVEATDIILRYADEVAFVNGLTEGRVADALAGKIDGTSIRKEETA